MYKPLEIFIGLRYLRAKRRNQFISFISLTSMVGIILGVTALITVLSVMNGFEKELRERILGMASHITITRMDGDALQDPGRILGRYAGLSQQGIADDVAEQGFPALQKAALNQDG